MGQPTDAGDTDSDAAPVTLYPRPTITILSPTDSATVTGPDVALDLDVQKFNLTGKAPSARWVMPPRLWGMSLLVPTADAHTLETPPLGYIAVRVDGVLTAETIDVTTTLVGLAPGTHVVEVELLYPDSDGFYPAVIDDVTFTVL
jgi:hypothetical protein